MFVLTEFSKYILIEADCTIISIPMNTYKACKQNVHEEIKMISASSEFVFLLYSNGSIRVDYDVMFNSTATNITAESLNTELEILINKTNGIVGNSLVLGKIEGGRLFIIKGT
jgi:hypothetical protein